MQLLKNTLKILGYMLAFLFASTLFFWIVSFFLGIVDALQRV